METTSATPPVADQRPAVKLPDVPLIFEDGIPMESPWHRSQMNLLIDLTHQRFQALGRTDYYTGGNMFIYFSLEQARNREYRGPDYFTVLDVDRERPREGWVVWEEDGRYPDLIVELLSDSTRKEDLGTKKRIYEQTFHTAEYVCLDRDGELLGWRLGRGHRYEPIARTPSGWMWCETLEAYLGLWEGRFQEIQAQWLRLYDTEGRLVLLQAEAERQRTEAERQRTEAERQRAEAAEERVRQLEAELRARLGSEAAGKE